MREVKINNFRKNPLSLPNNFKYTAHTGCEKTDDNSIASIEEGIKYNCGVVEFDLNFDDENNPVLSHDEPVGGEVSLKEAFNKISEYPGLYVNVDLKNTSNLKAIETEALNFGVYDRIFYTGVNDEFLKEVQSQTPNVPYYLNVDVKKSEEHSDEYINSIVNKVRDSGAIGINFNKNSASEKLVEIFHKNNLLVSIYTVDTELEMRKILSYSPDNITTRNPQLLEEIITESKTK